MKIALTVLLLVLISDDFCYSKSDDRTSVSKVFWGKAYDKDVWLFTMINKNGMKAKISNFGAIINAIEVPDNKGKIENIVIGYDSLAPYLNNRAHFGSLIGRYANRITNARFTLDGKEYILTANMGHNQLHGGRKGFDFQVWNVDEVLTFTDSVSVTLSYLSKDLEEGYPGNLNVKVNYCLTDNNELKIRYTAVTDKPTVLNLTNHSYFNLTGFKDNILNHKVMVYADTADIVDEYLIPTGQFKSVKGSDDDFTTFHTIGERISRINENNGGYDIGYKIRRRHNELALAAEVQENVSGREIKVYTTEPSLQFYTASFQAGRIPGHVDITNGRHFAFCLEAQHFPDSPNHPQFPSTSLYPGETYNQVTVYKFHTSK